MKLFKADLHIHSVLSPCASLEMSPKIIIESAVAKGLDIIAVTDHNSTKNVEVTYDLGLENNIAVIPGVEINTHEEIHVLAYFPDLPATRLFQKFLDMNLSFIENTDHHFGYQLVVDRDENIIEEVPGLLISSLKCSINQIVKEIIKLKGIIVPAHVNRISNSIIGQLGFIPSNLDVDAIEQSFPVNNRIKNQYPSVPTLLNSDAHAPDEIGKSVTCFMMEKPSFQEIKMALKNKNGREIIQ